MKRHSTNQLVIPLPVTESLSDGRAFIIDVMSADQMTQMFRMIAEASKNTDGFGFDEFPSEEDFRYEIKKGYAFSVMRKDTGEMVAGFILVQSKYFRGTKVVDPYIIVAKSHRKSGIGYLCFSLCIKYSKQLGFIGMYVDMFANNIGMLKIMERFAGFERVGVLPMGGCMPDGTIISSYIYYKDLRT